jgi:hypothetical protein
MSLAYADGHDALVDVLDAHVRDRVRRDGVDPQADVALVRRIAEEAVRAHDERSLTGQVAPVPDVGALVGELVARVSGFGPLQPYLDDDTVEEVWINDPSRVFVARDGRHELTNTVLTAGQVTELVERMLKSSGRRLDVSQPFVDAMLPEGHRLTSSSTGSAAASAPSTSASSRCGPAGSQTWSSWAASRRRRPPSSRRASGRGSTCSSRAARRVARPRCSTAWPPPSRAATG